MCADASASGSRHGQQTCASDVGNPTVAVYHLLERSDVHDTGEAAHQLVSE